MGLLEFAPSISPAQETLTHSDNPTMLKVSEITECYKGALVEINDFLSSKLAFAIAVRDDAKAESIKQQRKVIMATARMLDLHLARTLSKKIRNTTPLYGKDQDQR